ncbi:hypothetical protein SAMN05660642_03187 [Geodermatophilus siccatus]|uniref:Transposase DDE domain-containing protein n=1 Tax=Geodermatophilus siccatus TaxID=1137991 RepID=A0A1G9VN87_9ACTN|nr:hypothetical protein SAMN05660642_03187 [Geodermatophilus siccatus]
MIGGIHGAARGPNPIDRGTRGGKYHLLGDVHGLPLDVLVSAANRHDSLFVELILDSMLAIKRGGRGPPADGPVELLIRRHRRFTGARGLVTSR